ncbi:hypothetical protein GOP47_0028639 [Adiantum capillus-veneris]|nr:hypothetical protein GOP47_0028639 [Adiantum capillus-veneris]
MEVFSRAPSLYTLDISRTFDVVPFHAETSFPPWRATDGEILEADFKDHMLNAPDDPVSPYFANSERKYDASSLLADALICSLVKAVQLFWSAQCLKPCKPLMDPDPTHFEPAALPVAEQPPASDFITHLPPDAASYKDAVQSTQATLDGPNQLVDKPQDYSRENLDLACTLIRPCADVEAAVKATKAADNTEDGNLHAEQPDPAKEKAVNPIKAFTTTVKESIAGLCPAHTLVHARQGYIAFSCNCRPAQEGTESPHLEDLSAHEEGTAGPSCLEHLARTTLSISSAREEHTKEMTPAFGDDGQSHGFRLPEPTFSLSTPALLPVFQAVVSSDAIVPINEVQHATSATHLDTPEEPETPLLANCNHDAVPVPISPAVSIAIFISQLNVLEAYDAKTTCKYCCQCSHNWRSSTCHFVGITSHQREDPSNSPKPL